RFLRSRHRRWPAIPVIDQQIRTDPHQFPKNEKQNQTVRQNQADHRKHEQRKPAEKPRLAFVFLHVTERKDVDKKPDKRYDKQHQRRQIVEQNPERNREIPDLQPRPALLRTLPAENQPQRENQNQTRSEEHTSELQSRENLVCR